MVCESCGENPATIHLTKIQGNDERVELNFCEECASAQGISSEAELPSMLASIVASTVRGEESDLACPHCGLTFKEFRRKGRLGCPMDYEVFAQPLEAMLRKMHDNRTRHRGRLPRGRTEIQSTVNERLLHLRRKLRTAIATEAYEDAASIRDEINQIETGVRSLDPDEASAFFDSESV